MFCMGKEGIICCSKDSQRTCLHTPQFTESSVSKKEKRKSLIEQRLGEGEGKLAGPLIIITATVSCFL